MNKPIYKQWWLYVIIAVILIAGGVTLYFTVFKDNKREVKEASTKVESNDKDTEDGTKEEDKKEERCKEANAKCTKKKAQLDVTLAPGEEVNGEFVAEVPVGSTDLYFVFNSSAMGGEKSIVKLR